MLQDGSGSSRREFLRWVGLASSVGLAARAPAAQAEPPPAPVRGKIRFGISAHQGASWDDILGFWQEAEALGFDTAFLYDHLMSIVPGPPDKDRMFEPWSLLAALAARTSRLRLGVLVSATGFRHPALVAKMAATIDHVSQGRLILGLGAGWVEREHTALGLPFLTKGGRARRFAEAVEVIDALLTKERTTFKGKYFTLTDAPSEPKGVQTPRPPILIGGSGPKIVQPLAARFAQTWHIGLPKDGDALRTMLDGFDQLCRDVGRDPKTVERATVVDINPTRPAAEVRTQLKTLVAAGITHFTFIPPPGNDRGALKRFMKEIAPEVRAS